MKSLAIVPLLAAAIGITFAQTQPANLAPHRIHSGDLVTISIYGEPDLACTIRVDSDGVIHMPLLDRTIKADGLMPEDLEKSIAEAFQAAQILVKPFVTVTVAEYHVLRPVSVAGAVHNPITFQPVEKMNLLEAITRAGGLTPEAGPEILVSRTTGTAQVVQRVAVRALIDAADPAVNLVLQGGEEIRIPEAGKVYVVGNVKMPGAFSVHDAGDTTVLKVVALTQGLAPFASNEAYIYRRDAGSGSSREIPVDLGKIMHRKSPDVALEANDIFYIPDRSGKRITMSVLEKVFGVGVGVSSALVFMAH